MQAIIGAGLRAAADSADERVVASEPTPGSGFLGGSRPEGREGAAGGIGDVNAIGWRGGNIK